MGDTQVSNRHPQRRQRKGVPQHKLHKAEEQSLQLPHSVQPLHKPHKTEEKRVPTSKKVCEERSVQHLSSASTNVRKCLVCDEPAKGESLCCLADHTMCNEDAKNFVASFLASQSLWLPNRTLPHCPVGGCRAEFRAEDLMRLMNKDQKEEFNYRCLMNSRERCMEPDELLYACSKCDYFQYRVLDPKQNFLVFCDLCATPTCATCRKSVQTNSYEEVEHHLKCWPLASMKRRIDQALEVGSTRRCPSCTAQGRKDENCNHMKCESCGQDWCYFCGLAIPPRWNKHYENWRSTGVGCPLLLLAIHEVDRSWPASNNQALAHLHRLLVVNELRSLWCEDRTTFESCWVHFQLENSGFKLTECRSPIVALVKR